MSCLMISNLFFFIFSYYSCMFCRTSNYSIYCFINLFHADSRFIISYS